MLSRNLQVLDRAFFGGLNPLAYWSHSQWKLSELLLTCSYCRYMKLHVGFHAWLAFTWKSAISYCSLRAGSWYSLYVSHLLCDIERVPLQSHSFEQTGPSTCIKPQRCCLFTLIRMENRALADKNIKEKYSSSALFQWFLKDHVLNINLTFQFNINCVINDDMKKRTAHCHSWCFSNPMQRD